MIRRLAALGAVCALAALTAACSTPPSHLYTLSRTATESTKTDPSSSGLFVVVGPVSIPASVDLPQIVVRTGPNQVRVEEFNRWASPLQSGITHVVAENLVVLLGTPRVGLFQQSQDAEADYRVTIDVQTFESAPGDAATLSALWIVRRVKDGKTQTGRTAVREPTHSNGYDAIAAAHSRALGRMSQDIADAIRALNGAP
jgi:uncharacterized lipoprotein YmbA